MDISVHRRKQCRLCESVQLKPAFSLKPTPLANAFVPKSKLNVAQPLFPLDLFFCSQCTHLQLLDAVDPKELFEEYVYVSGTSPVFIGHFKEYAEHMITHYSTNTNHFVVEIGSNDGTLLSFFKEAQFTTLGIDPAKKIAETATNNGIETWPNFFNMQTAKKIKQERGQASLVIANNVFAHIDDLKSVVQGVKEILLPTGIFAFEVSYLVDVVQKNLFDTIYHEHVSYHSVAPLKLFFEQNQMELIDAQRINTHGGSIRCIAQLRNGPYPVSLNVQKAIKLERELKLNQIETFKVFSENIMKLKTELATLLKTLKADQKCIAGFGAPAKATTLMYDFELDSQILDYIVDDSPLKQGLYSPGLHIPVVPSKAIYEKKPDYLLILAWNFADSIIEKHKEFTKMGGKFIIPVPKVEVK